MSCNYSTLGKLHKTTHQILDTYFNRNDGRQAGLSILGTGLSPGVFTYSLFNPVSGKSIRKVREQADEFEMIGRISIHLSIIYTA